jgi:multicomponent Na+:H+ antiporter subunit E
LAYALLIPFAWKSTEDCQAGGSVLKVEGGISVDQGDQVNSPVVSSGGSENDFSAQASPRRKFFFYPFFLTFIIMAGTWILLSGKFDLFHMSLGVICCVIVAYLSHDLLFPAKPKGLLNQWVRFAAYIPWLVVEIAKASLHVTYLVFHPKMMDLIDPRIIKFRSKLTSDLSLVTFANSITLTPGTITVYVSVDGDFKVHAIDKASGDPLPGEMEAKVMTAFSED